MHIVLMIVILFLAYLVGSIPMGLLIVKVVSGQDIRKIHSGRTGGTNVMRVSGFWAGLATASLDILKGACGVWIAQAVSPGNHWLAVLAPIFTILGHNYSIFLIERNQNGKLRLGGGAGGSPALGGAVGLWPPILLILTPLAALILFGIGYASVATMSVPLIAMIVFAIRASLGHSPWIYVVYGALSELILIWALRPNIKRLLNGTERLVGWRAKRNKKQPNNVLPNKRLLSQKPPK